MDTEINISLIVPCYKVEKYLPRCLDSLVNQTLPGVEAICINDGSPDNSIEILRDYEKRYPGQVVVIDKQNEGVWKGRRDGIKIARGKFIGFIDSDDYVELDYCERLFNTANSNNADIAVCGFYREDVDTGEILNEEMTDIRKPFVIEENPERLLEMNGAPWNKLFKAELLKDLYDLPNPPKIFDDMMMHLLIFLRAKKIAYCCKPLVHYIIRGDSIMTTINEGQIESTYAAMLDVKKLYQEHGSKKLQTFLDAAAFLHMGISLMFRISCDPNANLEKALIENREYLNKNFPTWKTSGIISPKMVKEHGGVFTKLYGSSFLYRFGLMNPALSVYRWMISNGNDIKW